MKTILFVCTGNICRSPMATALARHRLAELGLMGDVQVLSAGVGALEGYSASALSVAMMARRGIALEDHRAQSLEVDLLQRADIVVVMEESQRRWIFHFAPLYLGKVYLLSELSGRHEEVRDPYGGDAADYERAAAHIESLVDAGMPNLLRQLGLTPSAERPATEGRGAATTSGA